MYKTVRHGESSLQYTILPQDADSAAACTVTKHTTSSGRTAVLIAICVVLVGGVVAAVVVPLLVSARLVLPAPHRRISPLPEHNTVSTSTPSAGSSSEPVVNISTTVSSSSETSASTARTTETPTTLVPSVRGVWSAVQVTATTPSTTTSTTLAPVLTTTSPPAPPTTAATPVTEAEIQTVSSSSSSSLPAGAVTTSRPHKSWLPSRWPFVDPANTYAQWTELARQSALVPAACLGALVLAVIIALGACLATRRRRQKAHRRRTIGKMSSELQQGDKTTLLTEVSEAED